MRKIVVALLLAVLSNAAMAEMVYEIDLSDGADRITSFEIAAHGSDRFRPVPIKVLDSGNGVTISVRQGDGGCIRDLRIVFADGHRLVRRDFDICKLTALRPGQNLYLAAQP